MKAAVMATMIGLVAVGLGVLVALDVVTVALVEPKLYVAAFFATLFAVGLKGFQHKNVINNLYGWTAVTSFAMAACDVLAITVIVKAANVSIILANGAGAALGMVAAMALHNRIHKGKK